MYKITNISNGLIVCDLADHTTLRLRTKETISVPNAQVTKHIRHLSDVRKITLEQVKSTPKKKKEE